MKICGKCKKELPLSQFHASSAKGHQSYCKRCATQSRTQWARDNPVKIKTYRIKTNHGLTKETYDQLLQSQNGLCGLCETEFVSENQIYIDHDHACCSGATSCGRCVRGLLHPHCNMLVGWVETYPTELSMVADYLKTSA